MSIPLNDLVLNEQSFEGSRLIQFSLPVTTSVNDQNQGTEDRPVQDILTSNLINDFVNSSERPLLASGVLDKIELNDGNLLSNNSVLTLQPDQNQGTEDRPIQDILTSNLVNYSVNSSERPLLAADVSDKIELNDGNLLSNSSLSTLQPDQNQGTEDRPVQDILTSNPVNDSVNSSERPLLASDVSVKMELNDGNLLSNSSDLTLQPDQNKTMDSPIVHEVLTDFHPNSESDNSCKEHQSLNYILETIKLQSKSLYNEKPSLDAEPVKECRKSSPLENEVNVKDDKFPALKKCSVLIERLSQSLLSNNSLKHSILKQVKKRKQLQNINFKKEAEKNCLQFLAMKKCSVLVKKLSGKYISSELWKHAADVHKQVKVRGRISTKPGSDIIHGKILTKDPKESLQFANPGNDTGMISNGTKFVVEENNITKFQIGGNLLRPNVCDPSSFYQIN